MVTLNLKEIFPVDSQNDIASKLNFNFNQLLALGFGQTGAQGPPGPSGPAGPMGPIGETGIAGSQIFSDSTGEPLDLVEDPVDAIVGDYYISSSAIYKKTSNVSGFEWQTVSNFNTLLSNITAGSGTSTWRLGTTEPSATSKVLVPTRGFAGYDRIVEAGSSGSFSTNDPNWRNSSENYTNSQVTLFNFDPNTTKIYVNGTSSDQNSYSVNISEQRLGFNGTQGTETAFPYSALLNIYSFYRTNLSSTEATQFDAINGSANSYRHQLELGSVDELSEPIVSTSPSANYVVSPTWQNLRIRKYRAASTLPGGAIINADFNLHSSDQSESPALNSRFTWRINRKAGTSSGTATNLIMSLSHKTIEATTSGLTGIAVDGLHMAAGTNGAYKLAIGIDSDNVGTSKNAVIASDSSNSLDTLIIRGMNLRLASATSTSSISSTGITSNQSIAFQTTGSAKDVTISNGSVGRSVFILSPSNSSHIYLGNSTSNITSNIWSTSSGYALKINRNRLAAGIPFPVSTSALPQSRSFDQNVLDEYQEQEFIPTISWDGTLPVAPTTTMHSSTPTIADELGRFVKIGRLVHFSIRFSISNWGAKLPTVRPNGAPNPIGKAWNDVQMLNYGNLSTSNVNPFINFSYGTEPYWLRIRDLPDHWPAVGGESGAGYLNVDVEASLGEPGLRGNPFAWSFGGSGTSGVTGSSGTSGTASRPWPALDPATLHASFTAYLASGVRRPQIQLFGNRRIPLGGSTNSTITHEVSPVKSRVSIYDFLKPIPATKKVWITIYGTFMVDHLTTEQGAPTLPGDPQVADPNGEINNTG